MTTTLGRPLESGFVLGVGVELEPLVHRIEALGKEGKGGIQAVGLKEFIDFSAQRHQQLEQVRQQLQRGEVPNHVALGFMGTGLARVFHRLPLVNATRMDGTSADPVNQRFGGRIADSLPVVSGQKVAAQRRRHGHSERCALQVVATGDKEALNTATEWHFLFGCGRAVVEAIVKVWDTGSRDHAAAQAEWLLNNVYTDDRGFHGTVARRTEAKDAYFASAALTSWIVHSIRLDEQESLREARREYLQWLHQRVIRGRFATDVDLARAVVEQLKETITQSLANDDEAMGTITLHWMRPLWLDLPSDLRKLMEPDQEFLRRLGISMRSIVDIGPLRLGRQSFWDTLSRVLKDGVPEELTTLEGHLVRIELVSDSPILFSFHCDDPKFDGKIGSPELGFLSESFAEREATASCLKHWFDLPKSRRDELVARIVGGHDPRTRVELASSCPETP